jgi:MarR family transcriptional regulator, lower aerobic nicotinate degradation pathway regulator
MPRRDARPDAPRISAPPTILLLAGVARRAADALEAALAPLGLRARHYRVLAALAEAGPLSQQALGRLLGIDRTTMVAVVDAIEQLGLAERRADEADRRAYRVALTARGRTTLVRATGAVARAEERLLGPLDARQREVLRASLDRLAESGSERSGTGS